MAWTGVDIIFAHELNTSFLHISQLQLFVVSDCLSNACRMVILYDEKDDAFRAKILDPGILDIKLADKGCQLGNWTPPASHLTSLTFRQDLLGSSLCQSLRDANVHAICHRACACLIEYLVIHSARLR